MFADALVVVWMGLIASASARSSSSSVLTSKIAETTAFCTSSAGIANELSELVSRMMGGRFESLNSLCTERKFGSGSTKVGNGDL